MQHTSIRTVAIIGGGPSGLALVKTLNAESTQFEIDLYDSRSKLGGIWNYITDKVQFNSDEDLIKKQEANFTPIYDRLETNIPHRAMEFTNFLFPKGTADFPSRTEVLNYLKRYAATVGPFSEFLNSRVVSVKKEKDWDVTSQNLKTGESIKKQYDAVIIANGHFEVPRIPTVEGLEEWKTKDPKSVTHAKFYDVPDVYKDQTVLVVGAVSSGTDIAIQASESAKKVYVSCDEKNLLEKVPNKYINLIPRIDKYDVNERSITFQGTTIKGIDRIVFCTGYLYDVPFLDLDICRQRYIDSLYKQIFYTKDPSLVFVGLAKDVAPFPLAEAQATVIARYFSGRLKLPSYETMEEESKAEVKEKGVRLHGLKFPKEAEYINDLHKIIEDQGLYEGFMFDKCEGDRFELRKRGPEMKLKKFIENNHKILQTREKC